MMFSDTSWSIKSAPLKIVGNLFISVLVSHYSLFSILSTAELHSPTSRWFSFRCTEFNGREGGSPKKNNSEVDQFSTRDDRGQCLGQFIKTSPIFWFAHF